VVGLVAGAAGGLLAEDLGLHNAVSYWGPRAPVIAGVAVLAALLWPTRLRPLVTASVAGLGVLWLAVAFTPLTTWMAQDLVRRDPLRPADAIVVLASSLQRDGDLTPTSMSRLVHGLVLLGEGHARRLILPEIYKPPRSYAASARALMKSFRIEGEVIAVGPVYSTRDEARAVKQLFEERDFSSLIVVTSPTHTRRAAAAFEKQGLTVLCSPAVETSFDLETLNDSDDRRRAFGSLLHEHLGLWLYTRRGEI
jgi:uncharacterized SAM-binding protein YcdF (DUF218 family)